MNGPMSVGFGRRVGRGLAVAILAVATRGGSVSPASDVVTFGFVCADPKVTWPAGVKQVVSDLMAKHGDDGVAKWGDRAVPVRLRRADALSYFVPVSCGATGNCTWAIVASSPARSLGTATGAVIFVKTGGREWPSVNAFSTMGAGQGAIETLEFSSDAYHHKKTVGVDPSLVGTIAGCLDNRACCPPAT